LEGVLMKYGKILDISVDLNENTYTYPGDPELEYVELYSTAKGDRVNLSGVKMSLHQGTHVDAPYHMFANGMKIDEIPMEHWIGKTYVADMTHICECIRDFDILLKKDILKHKRVLFKTKNSVNCISGSEPYGDNIYLDESACRLLAESNVITVGFDYLTIDPLNSIDFPAHKELLSKNICIIENIKLDGVSEGEYHMVCLPLKVTGRDGSPARVILIEG